MRYKKNLKIKNEVQNNELHENEIQKEWFTERERNRKNEIQKDWFTERVRNKKNNRTNESKKE